MSAEKMPSSCSSSRCSLYFCFDFFIFLFFYFLRAFYNPRRLLSNSLFVCARVCVRASADVSHARHNNGPTVTYLLRRRPICFAFLPPPPGDSCAFSRPLMSSSRTRGIARQRRRQVASLRGAFGSQRQDRNKTKQNKKQTKRAGDVFRRARRESL